MVRRLRVVIVAAAAAFSVAAGDAARAPLAGLPVPVEVQRLLLRDYAFTRGDMGVLGRGAVIARALPTPDDRDVAVVGAVRVDVPPDFYAAQLRDIARFKRHEAVLQIGVFSRPPDVADVAALTLDADDLQRLRGCRPGRCDLHLSIEALARLQAAVDWRSDQAPAQANRAFRAMLTDMVRNYHTRGNDALMTYEGGDRPLSVHTAFRELLEAPPALLDPYAPLAQRFLRYPHGPGTRVSDLVYWSKEKVGPRVVINVTHMAMAHLPPSPSPVVHAIASRQVYGSQLFEASLGLTLLLADANEPGRMYLVYANRSRIDAIGGLLGVLKRGVVRSRARASIAETIERTRGEMERRYREHAAQVR